jgi:predicted glycoside hydrolase/deacetylase ChbG (UPF0249 family)
VPTSIIVNADDFGFSPGVTDAIIDCHHRGILTSTTLMCTMPDAARAASLAAAVPNLGVGIHLCLTQGTPLSKMVRVLAKPSGMGLPSVLDQSVPQLIRKLQFSKEARNEARCEWRAQIEFAMGLGLKPTHLDSHKHIHHWPVLQDIAIELAREYNIPAIRCARETRLGIIRSGLGYRLLVTLAYQLAKKLARAGLQTTDWFYGLAATGAFSEQHWLAILDRLPSGKGEIMIHPGQAEGLPANSTRLVAEREIEWQGATSRAVRQGITDRKIPLGTFAGLVSMASVP